MRAKKSLGQNFLMHQATADRIADVAEITPDSIVLEIGPGTGKLTRALLLRAKRVIAVEADAELIPILKETFAADIATGKLELVHADIRTFDPAQIGAAYILVANIPYYITGEIIRTFLTATHKPTSMTLLVQKEVAERIARTKKESILSIAVKAFGTPIYRFSVPRGNFQPKPNVDSAVLSIINIKPDAFGPREEEQFFAVVRAGFAHKRKLVVKNLEAITDRDTAAEALAAAHIPEKARAEDIPLTGWRQLTTAVFAQMMKRD